MTCCAKGLERQRLNLMPERSRSGSERTAIIALGLLSLAVTLPAEFWRTNARGEQFKHTHPP